MSTQPAPDPDVTPVDVRTPLRREGPVVLAVAVGGVLGAEARYGVGLAWPHATTTFPWSTLVINITGSFLLSVLLVVITERWRAAPQLTRPLLGTGVLGGYTTFSTFGVDIARLGHEGHAGTAVAYTALTLLAGVLAVLAGRIATRAATRRIGATR